ncbi:MAG: hypothetical protein Q8P93_04395 [bacterium]|nr:hypothetical protein [bacterium]
MQPKTLYITIGSLALIALLSVVGYVFMRSDPTQSTDEESSEVASPFPFGDIVGRFASRDDEGNEVGPGSTSGSLVVGPVQVIDQPQAGFVVLNQGGTTAVRYLSRETGHVFDYTKELGSVRLSNRTIPHIIRATWKADGGGALLLRNEGSATQRVVRATLDRVETANEDPLSDPSSRPTPYTLGGETLPSSIISAVLSPDGETIALLERADEVTTVSTLPFESTESVLLFSSPHPAWGVSWDGEEEIVVASLPSPNYAGVSFMLESQTGRLTQRGEGVGLTFLLGPDAGSSISTRLVNGTPVSQFNDHALNTTISLPFVTYPQEKCVYVGDTQAVCAAPSDNDLFGYPHRWYQGYVSFTDDLWLIDRTAGTVFSLYDTDSDTLSLDMVNLSFDNDSNELYFENKRDNSVWMIALDV